MTRTVSNDPKIKYLTADSSLLDNVKLLWEALNNHHLSLSNNFKHYYEAMTFEKRKAALMEKAKEGQMRVDIALDELSEQKVGYCVSTIDKSKTGEIDSIYVDINYRCLGIGDALIRKAIKWMDENGAESKIVEVGAGNEDAFRFYARNGFLPRKTVLKQVK